MLKYIKVKNFLSFQEETEINFEASNYGGKNDNVFNIKSLGKKTTFSKSMLIYGANASGKSNILKIIDFIQIIATDTTRSEYIRFRFSPFLLDLESETKPSFFEICFFVKNKQYIFNFEIFENKILTENLIEINSKGEKKLYSRKNQEIKFDKSFEKEAKKGLEKVKENVSFFAVLGQWNGILNKKPIDYFFKKINIIFNNDIGPGLTIQLLELGTSDKNKHIVIEFLKSADINIDNIEMTKKSLPDDFFKDFNDDMRNKLKGKELLSIRFGHKLNNSDKIKFLPMESESSGTQKLFYILGPIIDSILNERILFVDEIEANLHPHILRNLFKLIHTKIDKKYQFIFTTHNIDLMDLSIFKKEQIGIVSKNKENISSFYTLFDFNDIPVRTENDIRKLYNLGSLGGTPKVSDFSILLNDIKLGEKSGNDENID